MIHSFPFKLACFVATGLSILAASPRAAEAFNLEQFEKRVTVTKLDNGLTLVICERREAPVFSFFTHVNVGGAQEVPGITGLAHMFEHMAFKGTDQIGTKNWAAEKEALERVEAAYHAYDRERRRQVGRDKARVKRLHKAWQDAIKAADRYVIQDEFTKIVERVGGVGVNAFTNSDSTGYFYSMPSNRLELWAYLESERFLKPVMREFYKERAVVREERRMRTESRPTGRLIEQFLSTAYIAHPYGFPVVGWPSDLATFSATDAAAFFRKYYIPANMTIGVVGDVKTAEVIRIAKKYFGRWPKRPRPEPLRTREPPQKAERVVTIRERAQPFYLEGYHKPGALHPDDVIYTVIQDLMSSGRTSRLYRSLVRDKRIAAAASGFNGYPGRKYPNMFVFYAVPLPGHKVAEVRDAIRAEIARLQKEPITDAELKMVRTRAKANLIRRLASNSGLAIQLAGAQARYGDWREIFRRVKRLERVTKEDILRVARKTFVPLNRTVGILESTAPARAVRMRRRAR